VRQCGMGGSLLRIAHDRFAAHRRRSLGNARRPVLQL
jgi:hypothetical protein